MKLNSVFIFILFVCSLTMSANEQTLAFDSANTAYAKGNYEKAIKLYESVLNKGLVAPELYFNLGNAYYKTNNISSAILNYERAKKLAPDNEDINANLKLANQKIEDKIEAAPQLFLLEWKNAIVDLMTEKGWSYLCILLIIVSLILFAVYIISSDRNLKQLGFFGGIILILFATAIFFVAQNKYELTKNSTEAIITSASVTIMGSPDEKGTKLFILHEGAKVSISQENTDWIEIKIANGNVGWIKTSQLKKI